MKDSLILTSAIIGFIILVTYGLYFLDKMKCGNLSENLEIETKYRFFGGSCLLRIDGKWIPEKNWRNIN